MNPKCEIQPIQLDFSGPSHIAQKKLSWAGWIKSFAMRVPDLPGVDGSLQATMRLKNRLGGTIFEYGPVSSGHYFESLMKNVPSHKELTIEVELNSPIPQGRVVDIELYVLI